MNSNYQTGLDQITNDSSRLKKWGRLGLVCNQASVDVRFTPMWKVLHDLLPAGQITNLFGPQHGFESTLQENMIESSHGRHLETGLPVHSLYSETREPTKTMLEQVDTIVIDLPITGCRIYTYKYTMAACLRAAAKLGKKVVVLDRPNPLGGVFIEGPVLEPAARSFVGEYELPTRHGLTMGEAAKFFNLEIRANLEVIPLSRWDPQLTWNQYSRPWILTSPNLPTFESCAVFPGFVHFEGCNVSEGRGTTLPFQLIGASFVQSGWDIVKRANKYLINHDGFHLRPASFTPVSHKDKEKECQGVHVIITDLQKVQSVQLGLALLRAFWEVGKTNNAFKWREPPYEYEYKILPIEIIYGRIGCVDWFESNDFNLRGKQLQLGHSEYIARVKESLLYPRQMISL